LALGLGRWRWHKPARAIQCPLLQNPLPPSGAWGFGRKSMQKLDNGTLAPRFTVDSISGQSLDLALALEKSPVILVFAHPTINAARLVVGYLRRMASEISPDVQVWIAMEGDEAEIRRYIGTGEAPYLTMPVIMDRCVLAQQYKVGYLPTMYFISQDGTIKHSYTGFNRDLINLMAAEAAAFVGAKPKELITDADNKGFYELAERGPCL
jgi:hypothetical protein